MSYYNQTYTRNTHTISITITLNTGSVTDPDGATFPTHTVAVSYDSGDPTLNDGTNQTYENIRTEDLLSRVGAIQDAINQIADGITDPVIDRALIDNGYTYTP